MKKIFLWGCLAWLVLVQMGCSYRHEDITFPDDGVIRYLYLDEVREDYYSLGGLIYCYGVDWSDERALYTLIPLAKQLFVIKKKRYDPYGDWKSRDEKESLFVSSVAGLKRLGYTEDDDIRPWNEIMKKKKYLIVCSPDENGSPVVKRIEISTNEAYPQDRIIITDRKWIDDVEQSQTRTFTFQKIEASTWKDVRAASRAAWEAYEQKMVTH